MQAQFELSTNLIAIRRRADAMDTDHFALRLNRVDLTLGRRLPLDPQQAELLSSGKYVADAPEADFRP
jgi:hypothetical protein